MHIYSVAFGLLGSVFLFSFASPIQGSKIALACPKLKALWSLTACFQYQQVNQIFAVFMVMVSHSNPKQNRAQRNYPDGIRFTVIWFTNTLPSVGHHRSLPSLQSGSLCSLPLMPEPYHAPLQIGKFTALIVFFVTCPSPSLLLGQISEWTACKLGRGHVLGWVERVILSYIIFYHFFVGKKKTKC